MILQYTLLAWDFHIEDAARPTGSHRYGLREAEKPSWTLGTNFGKTVNEDVGG